MHYSPFVCETNRVKLICAQRRRRHRRCVVVGRRITSASKNTHAAGAQYNSINDTHTHTHTRARSLTLVCVL